MVVFSIERVSGLATCVLNRTERNLSSDERATRAEKSLSTFERPGSNECQPATRAAEILARRVQEEDRLDETSEILSPLREGIYVKNRGNGEVRLKHLWITRSGGPGATA